MPKFANHKWWILTVMLTAPWLALAADVPNVFKAGDVISSAQVNDNFKNLSARLTALEAAAPPANPWVKADRNMTKAVWDTLIAKFPPDQYEWGVAYNTITAEAGPGATIHRVIFSAWNAGIRISTEEFLQGDGANTDPATGGFNMGGAAWFFGTNGTFDDACTQAGAFKHQYWQRSSTGITMLGGNGCGGGTWYVRRL